MWVGDDEGTSDVAIRAENRRMFVNRLQTGQGTHHLIEFTVNIRDSLIAGSKNKVRLKSRNTGIYIGIINLPWNLTARNPRSTL
ncbi:hypothetical protein KRR40_07385 [Niabella defluvii]|nr:hypothetical protein KRR40_07385 [Niabella sp. I65]